MTQKEFCATYLPLSEALYRVAFYFLERKEDAEDAIQDLFVKLWNSRETLSAVHNPKAYSITLMRNLCIDRIRSAERNSSSAVSSVLGEESASLEESNIEQRLDDAEKLNRVFSFLQTLAEGEREVLKLKVLDGMDYNEISKQTGMNPLTLRVLLSRARKKIRKVVK